MLLRLLMHLFIAASVVAVVGGLGYVYVKPPAGMHVTSEGVPYLSPPVAHPATGEAIPLERLVQHYKGGGK
ncbi:MAG: hypothetical protein HKUEN07_31190 [Rhodocyclaceae bacterium]|uniref:Uncharacterized protein n=1 Tax=Candidatus Desulfobacillus denitrificans TaxID=2608985 RepID=A0A809RKR0_9PROT|nr:MAG: hypothetical protein B6D47_13110 [Rhodocyclaceae bacterium UTPRO2]BBO20052.1 conserved hypothetical protein [Candidatus Desulfobacillus denitrificans]GIK46604.1 MAG: hypothetical protein BroJett012_25070 [Betaproteobacteria bacterium]GJQ56550.1 MAG: hypothetical protein HKUEN07_31190 [Rhodocyclaceae bacterium]